MHKYKSSPPYSLELGESAQHVKHRKAILSVLSVLAVLAVIVIMTFNVVNAADTQHFTAHQVPSTELENSGYYLDPKDQETVTSEANIKIYNGAVEARYDNWVAIRDYNAIDPPNSDGTNFWVKILYPDYGEIVDKATGTRTKVDVVMTIAPEAMHKTNAIAEWNSILGEDLDRDYGYVCVTFDHMGITVGNMLIFKQNFEFFKSGTASLTDSGATGTPANVNGSIWVMQQSLDMGEGFAAKNVEGMYVTNDMPNRNNQAGDQTYTGQIRSDSYRSVIPGSNLYEFTQTNWWSATEGTYKGLIGATIYTDATDASNTFRWQEPGADDRSQNIFGTTFDNTHLWASGALKVSMSNTNSVELRNYAVATRNWPHDNPGGLESEGIQYDREHDRYTTEVPPTGSPTGYAGMKYFATSFMPLTGFIPEKPVKAVDKTEVYPEETITYTITQPINDHGDDLSPGTTYEKLEFTDSLPAGTTYVDGSFSVKDTSNNTVTSSGTLTVNNGTLKFSFNKNYLTNTLVYNGKNMTFTFKVKVNSTTAPGTNLVNKGTVTFNNDYSLDTNPVTTKVLGYPVHYMWRAFGESEYTQVKLVNDIYGNYPTLALSAVPITITSGCTPAAYGKNTTGIAPADNQLSDVTPGQSTPVKQETWLWASETKNPTYNVHYMFKPYNADDYTEKKTITGLASGASHTVLAFADANITKTDSYCTLVGYGETTTSTAPTGTPSGTNAGKSITIGTTDIWLWATETRTVPHKVHYMFKPFGAEHYTEKKTVENVMEGASHTVLAFADANITASSNCTLTGYGETTTSDEPTGIPSGTNAGDPITMGTTDIWLWATETHNPVKVHYMWKPVNGEWNEVATENVNYGANHTSKTQSAFTSLSNVTVTTGCTWKGYGKTDTNTAPTAFNALSAGSPVNNITKDVWLWATEDWNSVKVHYMWKPINGSWNEVATENVTYNTNHTTKTETQFKNLSGVTVTTGCNWKGYGKTDTETAPSAFNTLKPGDPINNITKDVWVWATEEWTTVKVHYMWKPVNGEWNEVDTVNVTYNTEHTSKTQAQFTGLSGVTVTTGCNWMGYGQTNNNTAPSQFNTTSAGAGIGKITKEVWLWATEDWKTVKVHYMWKPVEGSWNEVATDSLTYNTNHSVKTKDQFKNLNNVTFTTGCAWQGYGKTDNNTAPSEFGTTNPGSSLNNVKADVWLWATEDWTSVAVHYMWKPAKGSWSEVATESVIYNRSHTVKTEAQFVNLNGVTVTTGHSWQGYTKTNAKTPEPTEIAGTAPGSTVNNIIADIWLWASEKINTYPVHYMYSTGPDDPFKEVKLVENVPYGDYTTLKISDLDVTPKYPQLVNAYGKTVTNVAPGNLTEIPPSTATPVISETWFWAQESPLINGSQVTTYKWSDPAPNTLVEVGQEIEYQLTHTNTGAATSAYTLVRDYIPEGVEYVDGSVSEGGVYVAADKSANGKAYVEWVKFGIPSRASVQSTFKVKVLEKHPVIIRNHALTGTQPDPIEPGASSNPDPQNKSNEVQHPTEKDVLTDPQVEIIKSSIPVPGTIVHKGTKINYTLTVKNSGGQDAVDVAVFDEVPKYTKFISVMEDFGGTAVNDNAAVGWNIPKLSVGESVDLKFVVEVTDDTDGNIVANQATYCRNTPGIPTSPLPNSSNIVEHPVKPKNIITGSQVTTYKDSEPAPNSHVEVGQEIKYILTHKNTGATTSAYTLVRDYIPEGVEYVDGSVSEGGVYVSAEKSSSGRAYVEWVKFGIPVGGEVQSTFSVKVAENPPSIIRNHALTGTQPDPLTPGDPGNPEPELKSNEVRHTTDGTPCGPQIRIVKSSDPVPGTPVIARNIITYYLEVSNIGDETAYNVGVYDEIPQFTSLVDFVPEYNCTSIRNGEALGWNIPEIEAGKSVTLSFKVMVDENLSEPQIIWNQASYVMDYEGIPESALENTSNIVEHPYIVKDDEYKTSIIPLINPTGDNFPLTLAVIVGLLSSGVFGAVLWRRRSAQ